MIGNADFMRHVLECFGVIFKFGGEKIRTKAVDVGATEYYSEYA